MWGFLAQTGVTVKFMWPRGFTGVPGKLKITAKSHRSGLGIK